MANERARTLRKNLTRQEVRIWVRLRQLREAGFHFRRQAPIGPYIADFMCLKHRLIVEIDGGQHGQTQHVAYDETRDAYLRAKRFEIARFWNSEVDANITGVIETIVEMLASEQRKIAPPGLRSARPTLPSGEGEHEDRR